MPTISSAAIPRIVARIVVAPLQKRIDPVVATVVTTFGGKAVAEVDADAVFRPNKRVSGFLRTSRNRLVGVNKTTQEAITRVLAKGVDAGKTVAELAAMVSDKFDEMSKGRAKNVARTAVSQASNFARKEGYKQVAVERKQWLTTLGGDSRASHVAMDGQTRGIDEAFNSPEGGTAQYPGDFGDPGEDVNCQCTILPVLDERGWRARDAVIVWKALDRQRAPFEHTVRVALGRAFADQKSVVMAAIRDYDDVAAAA